MKNFRCIGKKYFTGKMKKERITEISGKREEDTIPSTLKDARMSWGEGDVKGEKK